MRRYGTTCAGAYAQLYLHQFSITGALRHETYCALRTPGSTRTWRRYRTAQRGTEVHSRQDLVIFIHVPVHELVHTITGHAHYGDFAAP